MTSGREERRLASLRRSLATVRRTIGIVTTTIRTNERLAGHPTHRDTAQQRILDGHLELSRLAHEEETLSDEVQAGGGTTNLAVPLRARLRERLIRRGVLPETADRWIEMWESGAGEGDPASERYWDDAHDWIIAEHHGTLFDAAVVQAPTTRSFDA